MKDLPAALRPREKLLTLGPAALADAANATYLVSKDKAVLKLKRRMAKYCDVAVLPPKQFVALVQLETAPLVQA